ncbi:MAG TPA: glycoside hydrolase [Chloroflexota bacterium]|nr:glycoside hydrolase [Chloroflexota bacterium]
MKLVIMGGAGVRCPLIMPPLVRRQEKLGLTEVVLMDVDEEKLSLIAPIARYAAERLGATFRISATSDAREALTGADAVITTVRVGTEEGRVRDERIAFDHGVLGQETTGAGGFAMALRTIPVIAGYARLMRELCPDAWLLNFTNPAGLVVQALIDEVPDLKIAGICDTPSFLHRSVAQLFDRQPQEVPVRFYGLNHLSWMPEALVDGENVVPTIIADPDLRSRIEKLAIFDPDLLALLGVLPNEYLYYYYYRDRALERMRAEGETRGEQICRLSSELMRDLREIDPERHPDRALERYQEYIDERHGTYMARETGSGPRDKREAEEGGEGYAGVALDILSAQSDGGSEVVANVPNRGAVPGMRDDDVVEVACRVDSSGLHPIPLENDVPDHEFGLMLRVKEYERQTVEAIRTRSRKAAVEALLDHPLIGSYPISRALVDDYLEAHGAYVGEWE